MVPQRNSNPGRYALRRQDPQRFVQRGPPPMRNPSEMFFGRPPEKKPSEGKFIGGKNFYVLIVGLVIIIALLIILFSVKNENQNNNNANFSGNNPTNSSYQFINNIGNNANDNIPTDDGSDNGNLNGNDDDSVSLCFIGETKSCGLGIGICEFGIQECINGNWSECQNYIEPVNEICGDGLDNDCDHQVDDLDVCDPGFSDVVESGECGDNVCSGFESVFFSTASKDASICIQDCFKAANTCAQTQATDTEYKKNVVTGTYSNGSSFGFTDGCVDSFHVRDNVCSNAGDGGYAVQMVVRDCPSGYFCADGACKQNFCGDGVCSPGETRDSCMKDCAVCGDGICDGEPRIHSTNPNFYPENPQSCPLDCWNCGDGVCTDLELKGVKDGILSGSCSNDCQERLKLEKPTEGNLLLYYKFDDKAGNKVIDYSGNGLNGTLGNGDSVDLVDGKLGNAFLFGRSKKSYVAITWMHYYPGGAGIVEDLPLNLSSEAFTIEAWVKPDKLDWTHILATSTRFNLRLHGYSSTCLHGYVGGMQNRSRQNIFLYDPSGIPVQVEYRTDTLKCGSDFWVGQWHHVAQVYDGVTNDVYVDGKLEGSYPVLGIYGNVDHLVIGNDNTLAYYFGGAIDELKIWDYAKRTFDGVAPPADENVQDQLVAYYKFDESAGNNVADSGSNHFDGSILGDPKRVSGKSGNALDFSNKSLNNYVKLPFKSLFQSPKFTLQAFIKLSKDPNSAGNEMWPIIQKNGQYFLRFDTSYDSNYVVRGGDLMCIIGNKFLVFSKTEFDWETDKWYSVKCTYDGQTAKLYVDGILKKSGTFNTLVSLTSTNVYIGGYQAIDGTYEKFPGAIDEVKFYNYVV